MTAGFTPVQQATQASRHRIAVTAGEPAGIGADVILQIAAEQIDADLIVVASPELLADRAAGLGLSVELVAFRPETRLSPRRGRLYYLEHPLSVPVQAGQSRPENAGHVLDCIRTAVHGCLSGQFAALVTAPVNKALINAAGYSFSGHTEFIAQLCQSPRPVMMLADETLRVALVTRHLPLSSVPTAITDRNLKGTIETVYAELQKKFGIARPKLLVCSLNPHAGEQGYLGREEIEVISPVLEKLRDSGLEITGPCPADTAFTSASLQGIDAVIAMYHDQGLPVLKARGFGEIVNITLGLPIIRTSVDHGTALALAGTGKANPNSMLRAINYAIRMADARHRSAPGQA